MRDSRCFLPPLLLGVLALLAYPAMAGDPRTKSPETAATAAVRPTAAPAAPPGGGLSAAPPPEAGPARNPPPPRPDSRAATSPAPPSLETPGLLETTLKPAVSPVQTGVNAYRATVVQSGKEEGRYGVPAGGEQAPPIQRGPFAAEINRTAARYGVDPALIKAVVSVESNYNPQARSVAGALGLMQLMPGTARRFGAHNPLHPVQNLAAGTRYLKYLLGLFNGDIRLALAAYNAGEGNVRRFGNRIPFAETRRYVEKVHARYERYTGQKLPVRASLPLAARDQGGK